MRRLLVASLVAAGLSAAFAHSNSDSPRLRKTLGFGPHHPHKTYVNEPAYLHNFAHEVEDPFEVARLFIEEKFGRNLDQNTEFRIRKDSYTDKHSGVTHVFARQYIYGVEVADGDINLNIKDGVVISHGSSIFDRPMDSVNLFPFFSEDRPSHRVHSSFCDALAEEIESRSKGAEQLYSQGEQVVISESPHAEDLGMLPQMYEWNCAHINTPIGEDAASEFYPEDPTRALLQFMIHAHPCKHHAKHMAENAGTVLDRMDLSVVHDFSDKSDSNAHFVIDNVPGAVNPVKVRRALIQVPDGDDVTLEMAWKFEVEMQDNWYEAAVTAVPPYSIVSVVDWASDSPMPVAPVPKKPVTPTYNVFKWGVNDPSAGNRTIEKENPDTLASPRGWHALPYANDPSISRGKPKEEWRNTSSTWGNNVFAHENWEGRNAWIENYRPEAGKKLAFDFTYAPKETNRSEALEEAKKYINATVTQLFYTGNMIHDFFYRYGFDEVSGNFQQHNFGRGGEEGDAVIMNAQDGSGYNNANFMTPPDGQNGRCRMYLWNTANPYRDGDLEAGIVIHEYGHGLSTRLTGGPANSGCLGWGESGGMGEGWGDWLATTIRSNANYSDYSMGGWAANRDKGIRNYVYSLNETVNPSTYKTLDKPGYWGVHAIGEVWAEILWIASNKMIEKHQFGETLYPPLPDAEGNIPEGDFYRPAEYNAKGEKKPLVPKYGNALMIQLVVNGMKLQPCRPDFFDARDAIIKADEVLTEGENYCLLWDAFASRGLGVDAKIEGRTPWGGGVRTNGYKVPPACSAPEDTQ